VNLGSVTAPQVNEASGLVWSREQSGLLWVHNDSGDSPRFFALDDAGALLGIVEVTGANATDWEDMAIGPSNGGDGWDLFLGDIGDNAEARQSIAIYRTPEPQAATLSGTTQAASFERLDAEYPDGPHNAETLLVDPVSGDLYIVTKEGATSGVYRWAAPQIPGRSPAVLESVGTVTHAGSTATGGDVSPLGDYVIVRTYDSARLWIREMGSPLHEAFANQPCTVPLQTEIQGETMAINPQGNGYTTLSENVGQPLWDFDFE
jgi:hypothetical protein